uniref:Lipase, gastric n=1 Tax=Scophthalmus maximus TaxID=52904 RepID=A0A8D3CXY6_SCOMX
IMLCVVVCVFVLCGVVHAGPTDRRFNKPQQELDPEVHMNITEIIRRWHYPAEEHEVLTEDGFILSVNRIPQGRRHAAGTRPAVLLQHGLLAAGSNWISNPPNTSLGYVLADAGYDVWLGNSRGNTWSRKHQSLRPDQEEFWRFSHDEMALKDLPAVVNYILKVTGQKQIYYIGHSQGTTIAFIAFSTLPELASKIRLFVGLAPVATVAFTSSPMTKMSILPEPLIWVRPVLIHHSVVCLQTRTPVYTTHCPAGTSVQNMVHWAQAVHGGKLTAFDFGASGNMRHYNQSTAPEYQVQNMKVPTALFSGGQDTLADPKDVAVLLTQVSNLVFHQHIDHWEHLDFIWGLDAPEQMFPSILKLLHENC